MSAQKPLSYPTWEYILKHMSPDTRIPFAQRCPQIQKLDARLPLKVHNLHIRTASIKIDDLTYQLGVIQVYHGKNPPCVQLENEAGGSRTDKDAYGDSKWANERIKERRIETLKEQLDKQITAQEEERKTVVTDNQKLFFQRYEQKIKALQAEIEEVEQNGYIPPYTFYLQLISKNIQGRKVEHLIYNRKLSAAFPADEKSVTISKDADFQIKFYWGEIVDHEYRILQAVVERK